MKVLSIGCGNIGSVSAQDLAANAGSVEVVVADYIETRARAVANKIAKDNVSWIRLDITNDRELSNTLKDFDLVMGFLPGKLGFHLSEACVKAKKDLVDVSYMAENLSKLDTKATKANITIIPDCGLAPGISNFLVGHAVGNLDKVKHAHIMVGGLPETSVPPLGYVITWSPESLIDEYTRKAAIVEKGRTRKVEALTGLEEVDFPDVGKLEAFYTDGLRTLLDTLGNVDDMWEKTLRYPGHAEKVKMLKMLGFFDENQVDVENVLVSPRKLTVKLLGEKLWKPKVKDIVLLRVEISGVKDGKNVEYVYTLLDFFDKKLGITAMARTTAFPASIVAKLLLDKVIQEKGVVPPEEIGMHEESFMVFMRELGKRGVKITEEIKLC